LPFKRETSQVQFVTHKGLIYRFQQSGPGIVHYLKAHPLIINESSAFIIAFFMFIGHTSKSRQVHPKIIISPKQEGINTSLTNPVYFMIILELFTPNRLQIITFYAKKHILYNLFAIFAGLKQILSHDTVAVRFEGINYLFI